MSLLHALGMHDMNYGSAKNVSMCPFLVQKKSAQKSVHRTVEQKVVVNQMHNSMHQEITGRSYREAAHICLVYVGLSCLLFSKELRGAALAHSR